MTFLITLSIALIGGTLAYKLKVPAGPMLGAMFFVTLFNVFTGNAYFPNEAKIMTQIITGQFIGAQIARKDIISLRYIIKPALLNIFLIISYSLLMGVFLHKITDFSLVTTAFASAPGGIIDMTLISIDMGADVSIVSVLQLIRLLSVLGLLPTLITKVILRKKIKEVTIQSSDETITEDKTEDSSNRYKKFGFTLMIATISGVIGNISGIPAGPLIFAMIGVTTQNMLLDNAYMFNRVKLFAQICAGALIGQTVTYESIINLRTVIVPAIILVFGFIIITLVIGYTLAKFTNIDIITALFACAPGGASNLTLICGEFGANPSQVSIIQLVRVILVIALYPFAIHIITSFLS